MEHEKDTILIPLICPEFIPTNVTKNTLTGDGSPLQLEDKAKKMSYPLIDVQRKLLQQ